jgi:hypothetical protein
MPITNVKSKWVNGDLIFYDKSNNIICEFDGTNRELSFPATGILKLAAGSIETADLAAESVTADKLDGGVTIATLQESGVANFKAVDHADTSPVEIVAANGSGEGARSILILAVASETAAGEPDIDIGETGTVNKFIEDIGSGTWSKDDIFVAAGTLTEEKALIATIATAGSGGALDVLVLAFPGN